MYKLSGCFLLFIFGFVFLSKLSAFGNHVICSTFFFLVTHKSFTGTKFRFKLFHCHTKHGTVLCLKHTLLISNKSDSMFPRVLGYKICRFKQRGLFILHSNQRWQVMATHCHLSQLRCGLKREGPDLSYSNRARSHTIQSAVDEAVETVAVCSPPSVWRTEAILTELEDIYGCFVQRENHPEASSKHIQIHNFIKIFLCKENEL